MHEAIREPTRSDDNMFFEKVSRTEAKKHSSGLNKIA